MYVTFLRKDEPLSAIPSPGGNIESPRDSVTNQEGLDESGIALVCVGAGGEFEAIRAWCASVIHVRCACFSLTLLRNAQKMNNDKTLNSLVEASNARKTEYSVSELGIPGLRHFVYKSRTQVQITLPVFEDPYHQATERKRSDFLCIKKLLLILFAGSLLYTRFCMTPYTRNRVKTKVSSCNISVPKPKASWAG
jgi:hypothetical protein